MRWYEWLVLLASIGAIELMNVASITTAFKARERERVKQLHEWAREEANRMFEERLRNTRWCVTANVQLVNESDIDWGDKK